MIYFMQSTGGGAVKIGCTDDLPARHRALEAHYGQPLAILATMDGGRHEEARIHARFEHLRFGRTEQFRPAPDLMAFIGRPLLVGANPEAVEAMAPKRQLVTLSGKGSLEWRAWVEGGADHCRTDVSKLIDAALVEYLNARGYDTPPPRR